ncbi:MAG: UTP--glucose-1-phosphate uridylyltransferase [Planctomycetota bacterium]|nr:UTP--glucose-1-phosphate uridylyltransferase [Planctomycetota bacterium]
MSLRQDLSSRGIKDVFTRAQSQGDAAVQRLSDELSAIDLVVLDRQRAALNKDVVIDTSTISPPQLAETSSTSSTANSEALARGEKALCDNRVAVITVAGGQASRLGFNGPKGAYPLGAISGTSLFQMLAEQVILLRDKYQCDLPWVIQTGPGNHDDTIAYFAARNWFGMSATSVHFVCQGTLPALDANGDFMLTAPDKLFSNPDGHGGVYRAIKRSGMIDTLRAQGTDVLYYCQVDNPLVFMSDPTFIGHHLLADAQMSVKVVEKTEASEKVGLVVENNGKVQCIEYSDISAELQAQTTDDGGLLYRAGNIAVHVYDIDFFEEMAESHLPLHLARKTIKALAPGEFIPSDIAGIKFETFVFDALPLADRVVVQLADRELEFSPVKNRNGSDSAATSRAALSVRAKQWLSFIDSSCAYSAQQIELSSKVVSGPQDLIYRQQQINDGQQQLACSCGNKLITLA